MSRLSKGEQEFVSGFGGLVLKVLTTSERTIPEFQALAKYVVGYELLSQEQVGDEVIHVLRRKR